MGEDSKISVNPQQVIAVQPHDGPSNGTMIYTSRDNLNIIVKENYVITTSLLNGEGIDDD